MDTQGIFLLEFQFIQQWCLWRSWFMQLSVFVQLLSQVTSARGYLGKFNEDVMKVRLYCFVFFWTKIWSTTIGCIDNIVQAAVENSTNDPALQLLVQFYSDLRELDEQRKTGRNKNKTYGLTIRHKTRQTKKRKYNRNQLSIKKMSKHKYWCWLILIYIRVKSIFFNFECLLQTQENLLHSLLKPNLIPN